MNNIKELSKKNLETIRSIRREIHANPELGFEEFKTSILIQNTLKDLKIPFEVKCKTGVVGLIKGKYPGKTVLLRADIDALPIQEDSGVSYSSLKPNLMHACGHDGHTAGLIGAAMILNEIKDTLHGNVKLMFQPAEENYGGALPMIEAGLLESPKVDAAFGLHLVGALDQGQVGLKFGKLFASPDDFNFKIIGKGGHAAMPHQTIDPINIGVQVMNAMQNIVTRLIDPLNPVVLTFGTMHAGDAYNVIPNSLDVSGTFRCFDPIVRKQIPIYLENILKGICDSYNATYEFNFILTYPPLVNDLKMTEIAKKSIEKIVGKENTITIPTEDLGGEDFAFLCEHVPSSFYLLGIKEPNKPEPMFHHPSFSWNDDVLELGAATLAQIAVDFLNEN